MKRILLFIALLFSIRGAAFELQPWFTYPYEFHFRPSYLAAYYPNVNGATNPISYNAWNQELYLNFGFNTMSQFDTQIEAGFFNTSKTNATFQSAAVMGRYLLLDDVQGDPISAALGLNIRFVPDHALTDTFTPYHNIVNFETNLAIGKEFDNLQYWLYRLYGVASVGIANRGAPWVKGLGSFEFNARDNRNQCAVLVDSYFGFGSQDFVNINRFNSYAKIWHQNVDVSAIYRHLFDIWGTISIEFGYRVYAKNYPENLVFAKLKYDLPFSIF
ncbi:MAG: hypothetical protein P0S95_01730 [Rhabdochlamydiaceae bacterium]|nr:hypothetical protein [Candidatus Amphrikana amoebophyrae]